jgi:transposase InsO family protein
VSEEATAKDLWEKLGKLYQSKSLVNKLFLRKKFYNLRMRDGDSMVEHLNSFTTVVSQLVFVDIKILDEDKCISLLCSLPDSWDSLVVAIGSNTTYLKFEEVVSSLLSEEMRWKNMEGHSTDALVARGCSQERNRCSFSSGISKSKGRSKSLENFVRVGWRCGKEGHYKKQCRSKVEKKKESKESSSTEENTSKEEGGDVYLTSSITHADHEAWLVDYGASFHMTPHREWFCEYEKYDGGNVYLGKDSTTRIIGRGRVKLRIIDGRIRTLSSVLHIPGMARNLISVRKMEDAGVKPIFEKGTCRMVRGEMVLMKGVWFGTLYKMLGSTISDGCNSSIVPDIGFEEEITPIVSREKVMLWHQRLGHIGEKDFRLLHRKGMVEGMSNFSLDFDFCEHCLYGKKNRVRFPSGATRAEGILQLVHSGVFGPVSVSSLGKFVYYVSFIDDFSRKTWIHFLRNKSEVFDMFKEFKALVENQTKKRIKVLRTDNGGEFCGNEFEEFYKKCGISRQKTTPYAPQQNGVVERMNRTLMEKSSCMLSGVGLGKELWAEAVGTTCYLLNRSPSSTLDDMNPQEVWTVKETSLTHLKVFGCDAYVHVPKENRSKLDKKAEKCIFIGYKDGLKGYKLWNP